MLGKNLRLASTNAVKRLPYFRGKFRLINLLCPKQGIVDTTIYDVPMKLDLGEYIQRSIFTGHYEVTETKILKEYLSKGGTFVDVGANVGYYSAIALSIVGNNGCVISVEPTPELVKKLQKSFVSFQEQAIIVDTAVGSAEGEIQLFLPPHAYGNINSSVVSYCEGMTSFSVPVTTLDSILDKYNVSFVNLLKIDVEGYEPEVLDGGINSMRSGKIKAILIELNEPLLSSRGMSPEIVEEKLFSAGFILASNPEPAPVRNCLFLYKS